MLILCFKIFLSRILDVSLSSVRTMFVVKCNKIMASLIAFVEIFIWFYAAKEALVSNSTSLCIIVSYALGYATGTFIGTLINEKFISGIYSLKVSLKGVNEKKIKKLTINRIMENDEKNVIKNKGKLTIKEKVKSTTMLMLAVTLHNIPEGMAVGVAFAGLFSQNTGITLAEAFALAIGIAIQNIPEGAIISMPLHSSGKSKFKSFLGGTLSGIVEPIGAIITIALTRIVVPILPYFLSFAAGAMIYVVSSELIPEAQAEKKSNLVTISVGVGFVIMMLLDVALG